MCVSVCILFVRLYMYLCVSVCVCLFLCISFDFCCFFYIENFAFVCNFLDFKRKLKKLFCHFLLYTLLLFKITNVNIRLCVCVCVRKCVCVYVFFIL